jgi:alpha-L-fucosidase 2
MLFIKNIALCTLIFLVYLNTLAQQSNNLTLWYNSDAGDVFTNALPIGNGHIGGMVYGISSQDRIGLNESTFWSGGPGNNSVAGAASNLATARSQIFSGNYSAAESTVGGMVSGDGMSRYLPVGDLYLDFGHNNASNYYRELDLETAISKTTYTYEGVNYTREYFCSFPDNAMIVHLTANQSGKISFTASLGSLVNHTNSTDGNNILVMDGNDQTVRYQVRALIKNDGGSISAGNGKVTVSGANSVVIMLTIGTNFVSSSNTSASQSQRATNVLNAVASKSYEDILSVHLADYQTLFGRVKFNPGSGVNSTIPTNERIVQFNTTNDPQLVRLHYQFGRYLMISSSRAGGQPANLQGIWNADLYPSWGSKYTTNINLEMNYWMTETANLSECAIPLIDKVKGLVPNGRISARDHWGVTDGGWVLHHNTDLWNKTAPIDGTWGFWPTGSGWLCTHLWEHYQFGRDKEYLAEVFPIIKECAEFYLKSMVTETVSGENYLVTCPSASPELAHEGGQHTCFAPTMDNQIIRDVFELTTQAAQILGIDADFQQQCNEAKARLVPHQIGRNGQLQEWFYDWDDPRSTHRHISHLYGLFPSNQISVQSTPDLIEASKVTLAQRGDDATGWSLAWKINWWARLHEGDRAYDLIRLLLTPEKTYNNLFDAHPPFQIDGNFGAVSGVNEMLLQSQNGEIEFLPALPSVWSTGNISGLRARGGFIVDSLEWENGNLQQAVVTSEYGETLTVRTGDLIKTIQTDAGNSYVFDSELNIQVINGPVISITIEPDGILEAPAEITINVDATDEDGFITLVEFYNGNTKIGEDNSAPYSFILSGLEMGTHIISASATDNDGNTSHTSSQEIEVYTAREPFGGTLHAIPGTIQLEDFDIGGNGYAYFDTDAGTNVDPDPGYRANEDVDIEICSDTDGGYNLGWTAAGEWVEYTVNVEHAGTYDIILRASTDGDGKTISLTTDGVSLANDVAVTNTAGWQEWTDITIPDIELQSGEQVLRLTIGDNDYVNLNYMTFIYHDIPLEPIQLTAGWNLIGCPLEGSTPIQDALSSIWDNVEVVKDMDGFYNKSQSIYLNSLNNVDWGKGYLIKVNTDCELTWNH